MIQPDVRRPAHSWMLGHTQNAEWLPIYGTTLMVESSDTTLCGLQLQLQTAVTAEVHDMSIVLLYVWTLFTI